RLGQGSADRLRRDRKRASLYRTEAPEAVRSLVARRARRRHARPARHPYQRRLGRLLEQARPKQLARKSKPPLPITKIRSMISLLQNPFFRESKRNRMEHEYESEREPRSILQVPLIASLWIAPKEPSHLATWNAVCLADF